MTKYQPLGTRVLLKLLPEDKSPIALPDGIQNPGAVQRFTVMGVGGMVNEEKFKLETGDTVQLACHPSQIVGVDKEQALLLVDRLDIAVIVHDEPVMPLN